MPVATLRKPARKLGRPFADFSARTQLIKGAAKAFGKKGFADTSVEDICQAAHVARATFYRFFRSKDDVFESLLDQSSNLLFQSVRLAVHGAASPREKLEAGVETYLRSQAFAGPLAKVLTFAACGPNSRFAVRREQGIRDFIALFDEGLGRSKSSRVDELAYRGVLSALESISLDLLSAPGGMNEDAIQTGKQAMLRILSGLLE